MSEIKEEHSIDELFSEIVALRDLFARRLLDDKLKNNTIEKLSNSNSELIKAYEEKQVVSIAKELFLICDRIYKHNEEDEFAMSLLEELLDVLYRRGIEQISQLDMFDPKLHNCVSTVKCDDGHKPNSICSVIRHGYMFNQRVIRAADVVVYVE